MMLIFLRSVRYALQDFVRNFWLSLATLLVMIIVLFLVNTLIGLDYAKTALLSELNQRIDIALFFKPNVQESDVKRIQTDLEQNQAVASVVSISPDEGMTTLKERYPDIAEKILPALNENPLGYTLRIQARNLEDYPTILNTIENNSEYMSLLDAAHQVDARALTESAASAADKINRIALALASLFLVLSIIIMFNAIRVSIYSHRDEIAVMKLVGATNMYIRLPYVLESVLYVFCSLVLNTFLTFFAIKFSQPLLDRMFVGIANIQLLEYFTAQAQPILIAEFIAMALLSIISTSLALRKHLKV